ncbi:hypothetical protein FBU59_000318 [Linderina macrospora]|uniref:Uncharacterized protein n=1 Tax=Linderina macrospora TaxID=4868 RepID=A0ACC1JH61_9FUNG|nr:hypothetical protein FBU59_000318 [Linderina macrospora]
MLHTYETRLCPSAESIEVKRAFIEKFATILTEEFPEWEVDIHVFGSSVNGLGTSRSDVDICLTTQHRELENVFVLNKALRKYGMRTYCVPHARVPIVKSWDPELRIASDINVNNTIALHNTRMIQTFVAIDARVRPFVMAIKNWSKCREINDAAFGGTLSPYAWVNLALNFLQTRSPPILPVLHPPQPPIPTADDDSTNGQIDLSFNDDIDKLRGFGSPNQESLGFLLYAFFRTYAYEFDYRHQVVSLRRGCLMRKEEKHWDTGRPSRIFCIEEPFSTWLNLGHSANTVSVEGIRDEFQRAFRILRDGGSYDEVCEVYQRPGKSTKAPKASAAHQNSTNTSINSGNGNGAAAHSSAPKRAHHPAAVQAMAKSVSADFLQFPSSYSTGYHPSPFGICHSTMVPSPMALPAMTSNMVHNAKRRESDGLITLGATSMAAVANPWYATQSQLSAHQQKQELLAVHQSSPYSIIKENLLKAEQESAQIGAQLAHMSLSTSSPADALGRH